ncbi:hypothetical protein [Spirochaeta cellobiosiphila]|uniref:hypothetical protein n=1 Tax=Spirochaeta cellobiosiphila TaxID=504483 RepID=UPI0003FE06E2|nr:hypothetical protein [Spirochaeta cellobiosiphila]
MKLHFAILLFFSSFFVFGLDYYFYQTEYNESEKCTMLKIYQLDGDYNGITFINEIRFNGRVHTYYSEFENILYIVENNNSDWPWSNIDLTNKIYSVQKIDGRFVTVQNRLIHNLSEIEIDGSEVPHKVLIPSPEVLKYNPERKFRMISYYYLFQSRNGWSNVGPKFVEMIDNDNVIIESFYLQPHIGLEKEQQLHFNEPVMLQNHSIIYEDRVNHSVHIYDYYEKSYESIDGFLNGVAYLGSCFVITEYTPHGTISKIYNKELDELFDLSSYQYLHTSYIYKSILLSFADYLPGEMPFSNHLLIIDFESGGEIVFDENNDFLYENKTKFLGFYE